MRVAPENANPHRELRASLRTLVAGAILVAIAWMMYRPDRPRPFYVVDFSEFLPLLQGEGLLDGARRLFEYYASQGRFNAIPYVFLSVKWNVFSLWSPGWQVARAILMIVLFALTYVVVRRLGASRAGALAGATVYLWAPSGADGWVRLTMAEPFGALVSLGLAVRAFGFQRSATWAREVVLMSLGAVAIVWSKELLAPALLLPVVLALVVQRDGSFAFPEATRRNLVLVASVTAASLLALVPVLILYGNAGESAYASIYGREARSISEILAIWIMSLAPFELVGSRPNIAWIFALLGFTALNAFGWPAGFRSAAHGSRARWVLLLALIVPLAGVLAYIPIPWYARFYTLPYLIGPAILIAMAITFLQADRRMRAFALVATLGFAIQAGVAAATLATRTDAIQRRDARLIEFVADSVSGDSVHYAVALVPPYEWLGMGSSLHRFAAATGHSWPPLRHIDCETARRLLVAPQSIIIDRDSGCEIDSRESYAIVMPYKRVDVSHLRVTNDSAQVRIFAPAGRESTEK